jgi:nitroimidazol reductase NimA-like FMN-containing flavoprotein (pyridoxamine 5'-phosphate oxidase superfamily)
VTTQAGRLQLLDEQQCLEVLGRHSIGRLGLSAGALPVVLPVSFVLAGRTALFRTEPGVKLDAARHAAVACLEVDDYGAGKETGCSVLATGRLRVVTDPTRLDAPAHLGGAPDADHLVELPIELLSGTTTHSLWLS